MKITKFEHSCLLVEMPAPVNRTALFDPGGMSAGLVKEHHFEWLDDIVITHEHFDHFDIDTVKHLVSQFPEVRITAPQPVVDQLKEQGITASAEAPGGMELFSAPHESVEPLFPTPDEIGVHYLDMLTHPGDSLHFDATKPILALPVDAPWGAMVDAVKLALQLKPKYVLPVHDWMWKDEWRQQMYDGMAQIFEKEGIQFCKLHTGEPVVLEV